MSADSRGGRWRPDPFAVSSSRLSVRSFQVGSRRYVNY